MEPRIPTPLDDFFFDLRGYLVLENAVEPELVDALNDAIDRFPPLEYGEWLGNAQRRDYTASTGLELHNCVEAGEPFERLIDHPSWISYMRHYCGEEDSYVAGLFIDECMVSVRRSGGHHPVHSGGYRGALRGAYHYNHGVFRCGQCNIILALTDIGPGDGATMVIPGSHKSNFPHPNSGDYTRLDRMDHLDGAVPVYLKKGDALLFVDGLMHGGSSRTSPAGERRVIIYRYGVSWAATRFGYEYSQALLDRLTPTRRKLLQPVPPLRPPSSRAPLPGSSEEAHMTQELGIGLIGYGAIGRMHALCYRMLPLVYPDLPRTPRLVAVATASERSAQQARHEIGDLFVATDYRALVGHEAVDVIDCCAPTGAHGQMALAALGAGKGLICEKPLAATGAEAAAIASLAAQRGLGGGVFYHLRFVPAIQEAKRLIGEGLLGEVYSFQLHYYRSSNLQADKPATWRFQGPGSGVLQDLGSHLLDLVGHLLGPVARVSAHLRTVIPQRRGPDGTPVTVTSDDAALLTLELAGGCLGTVEASKVVPGAGDDIRIAAYGSAGAFVFDTRDPNGLEVVMGASSPVGARRVATLSFAQPTAAILQPEKPTGALQWYLAALAACCHSAAGEPADAPTFASAARVQRAIDAALQSAADGGAWVAIEG